MDTHLSTAEEDGGEEEQEEEKVLNLAKEESVERTGEEAGIQAAMQMSLNQVSFLLIILDENSKLSHEIIVIMLTKMIMILITISIPADGSSSSGLVAIPACQCCRPD